jgi:hypothetical protein
MQKISRGGGCLTSRVVFCCFWVLVARFGNHW